MPTYGYRCTACDHQFECFQKITDEPLTECPECKGKIKKMLYPVGIVFKGSGFHINDYKRSDTKSGGNGSEPKTKAESTKETVESTITRTDSGTKADPSSP